MGDDGLAPLAPHYYMPISFNCACGKAFNVPDEYAGKRTKCPVCQTVLTVPAVDDDFEVLDDEADTAPPPPLAGHRVGAAPAAAPPIPPEPTPPKRKKKKKKKRDDEAEETAEERLERVRAAEARVARTLRSTAFIVLGAAILIGVVVMFTVYGTAMKELGVKANVGAILMGAIGVAAIGKGVIGLFFGQLLGEE